MSTKSEVDLFEDIEEPQKDFWATLLNKESQKSTSKLEKNSPLKKETNSETSEDDDDKIVIVKEIQVNPPDLVLQDESGEIDLHSQIYSQNPITNISLHVDSAFVICYLGSNRSTGNAKTTIDETHGTRKYDPKYEYFQGIFSTSSSRILQVEWSNQCNGERNSTGTQVHHCKYHLISA